MTKTYDDIEAVTRLLEEVKATSALVGIAGLSARLYRFRK